VENPRRKSPSETARHLRPCLRWKFGTSDYRGYGSMEKGMFNCYFNQSTDSLSRLV
jgi:hypothetical protein